MKLQLKRSAALNTAGDGPKLPTAAQMEYGELAVNYNATVGPTVYTKDSADNIIEIVPQLATIIRTDITTVQTLTGKLISVSTISGDGSTTLTTKGYVDAAIAAALAAG